CTNKYLDIRQKALQQPPIQHAKTLGIGSGDAWRPQTRPSQLEYGTPTEDCLALQGPKYEASEGLDSGAGSLRRR
ncbi:hypothetical protein L9F63_010857, partial [Diploptera punctata]